jgi:hypothetical protein
MLQIIVSVFALLMFLSTAAKADMRYCGQASELATARLRWEAARRNVIDPAFRDKNCRTYGMQFYEAVTARQAVSSCPGSADHQRDLALLDSEIDAFNKLIATQCGG